MTAAMLHHIPLNSAYLCQDCDAIGNSSMYCPACGSQVLMGLASVFGSVSEATKPSPFLLPALAA